ncbi:MAG: hypothetical protein M0Z85_03965 [Gammaproteobacteria bacterium]|jgi:beta-lactamase superfamily II metal-dependent hydrolase|nr:hypothetical protein [Gammaproteobacteria bacterium]
MLDIVAFDVGMGQCVFFRPDENPTDYSMMVDCGHDGSFHPVDALLQWGWLPKNHKGLGELGNLTLTNYDHDHFDGLPYLLQVATLKTVNLAKNITVDELTWMKEEKTEALDELVRVRQRFTIPASGYHPPYAKYVVSLTVDELWEAGITATTNHLSQLVFVKTGGVGICVPGDLERPSWELMLQKPLVQYCLRETQIFFASHHGRDNGYHEGIFQYCAPECVIMSDKSIVHGTQENMASRYGAHVYGDGVVLGKTGAPRKVITTRNDGHIWIRIDGQHDVQYRALG